MESILSSKLCARSVPLERILIARGSRGPRIQEIIDLAREAETPVRFEDRGALDRLATVKSHQGVVAIGSEKKYAELEDVAPLPNCWWFSMAWKIRTISAPSSGPRMRRARAP